MNTNYILKRRWLALPLLVLSGCSAQWGRRVDEPEAFFTSPKSERCRDFLQKILSH